MFGPCAPRETGRPRPHWKLPIVNLQLAISNYTRGVSASGDGSFQVSPPQSLRILGGGAGLGAIRRAARRPREL